ncbi:MAG: hypothetical protein AAF750_12690 [Planctomycetota bacterium]
MIDRHDPNLLLDYLEGELPEDVAAEVESAMQQDAELKRLITELVADRSALRAMPDAEPPGELIEAVQAQLEREMLLGPPPEPIPLSRGHRNTQPPAANQPSHLRARLVFLGGIAALLVLAAGITLYSLSQTSLLNLAGSSPATEPNHAAAPDAFAQQPPEFSDTTGPVLSRSNAVAEGAAAPLSSMPQPAAFASIPGVSEPPTAIWFISNTSTPPLSDATLDHAYRLAFAPPDATTLILPGAPQTRIAALGRTSADGDSSLSGNRTRATREDSAAAAMSLSDQRVLQTPRAAAHSSAHDNRPRHTQQAAIPATPGIEQQLVVASRDRSRVESELRQWAVSNRLALISLDHAETEGNGQSDALNQVETTPPSIAPPVAAEPGLRRSVAQRPAAASKVGPPSASTPAAPQKLAPRAQPLASADAEAPAPASSPPSVPQPDEPARRLLLQVNTAQLPDLIGQLQSPGRALRLQQNLSPPPTPTQPILRLAEAPVSPLALPQRFPLSPPPPPANIDQLVRQDQVEWIEVQIHDSP